MYTSPEIQNSILNILGDQVRLRICDGVLDAGIFSILADVMKHCSKQEKLTIELRFVEQYIVPLALQILTV